MDTESAEFHRLLFGIQRSVRYHDRRVAHFENLHRVTNVLTILLSGIVIMDLIGKEAPTGVKLVAAFAAVLSAFDIVVGYSRKGSQHRDFKRRFIALERRLIKPTAGDSIAAITDERLVIEAEEPPVLRALDGLCHNELLVARGYSRSNRDDKLHFKQIPFRARLTANWLRWPNIAASTDR